MSDDNVIKLPTRAAVIGKRYTMAFESAIPDYEQRVGMIGTVTGEVKREPGHGGCIVYEVQTDDGWLGIAYRDELREIVA